ncbi:probable vacuolar amino acid transporter YPQ1 [Cryptomeria japonica]|uniref:probable vacuolar amino acid transporter YPQ1 n=1 Tax=Cryptomeria japonica TaxID=3369 RepID=UPI0027DA0F35|nr:probable vacuolar amino acid transporter YPQ1 [Cryptomeria japonica]
MEYHYASGKQCVWWVEKYLRECVWGVRGYVCVGLGLIGLLCLAIAGVPQIITNFKNGSTQGVSLGYLLCFLNLIGCWLDEATLATQLYTALVKSLSTLFFNEIQPKEVFKSEPATSVSSSPIPTVSSQESHNSSARSLEWTHTPIQGSYLSHSRECYTSHVFNQSSQEGEEVLDNLISPTPKHFEAILVSVASTIVFIGVMFYLKLSTSNNNISISYFSQSQRRSALIITGRKLLQRMGGNALGSSMIEEDAPNHLGLLLGWLMAAIYMGGRLPQICLNLSRGTIEGLNPLMFLFTLTSNLTYFGSIIVKTPDWETLKPDMPWLVDSGGCVLLDIFVSFTTDDASFSFVMDSFT